MQTHTVASVIQIHSITYQQKQKYVTKHMQLLFRMQSKPNIEYKNQQVPEAPWVLCVDRLCTHHVCWVFSHTHTLMEQVQLQLPAAAQS